MRRHERQPVPDPRRKRHVRLAAAGAVLGGVLAAVVVAQVLDDRGTEFTARPTGGVAGAESPVGTIRPRPQRPLRHAPGQLLVKFADTTPRNVAEELVDEAGGDLEERVRRIDVGVVDVPPDEVAEAIAELKASRQVEYVERDVILQTLETRPNDPLWPDQWGPARVGAPAVWDSVQGSSQAVIAVLDTGVDAAHPDLRGAIAPGYDFIGDDADPADDHGHGTAVAGVAAARADNTQGMAGICWGCTIMPVKVLDSTGSGSSATVAAGIVWAVDHGARIINLSLGAPNTTLTLTAAIDYAASKGAVVIAAAGNDSSATLTYPAAHPAVIGVAGTKADDSPYVWTNSGDWVQVAAPGCNLAPTRGGDYVNFCGTSSAAPIVAGLAGLALSYKPGVIKPELEQAITGSGGSLPGVARYGRVDARKMIAALARTIEPAAPADAPVSPQPAVGAQPPSAPAPAAPITPSTRTASFRGALSARSQRRTYRWRAQAGSLSADLRSRGTTALTLTLRDERGKAVASASRRNRVRLVRTVPAGAYRLVVSGRKAAAFSLVVSQTDR